MKDRQLSALESISSKLDAIIRLLERGEKERERESRREQPEEPADVLMTKSGPIEMKVGDSLRRALDEEFRDGE